MTSSYINPASVDFLQTVLSHLKNADGFSLGPILTTDVGGCPIYNEDAYLRDEHRFLEGMHGLAQLRETRRALSHLLSSVERTQENLRSTMYPAILSRGIDRLPEEILSYILTLAGAPGWKAALYLSWVSRRFRAVALATPRLWSSLPPACLDDLSREAMSCFLERSKKVGLTIELPLMMTEEYRQNPEWTEAVNMLTIHKHQWKELTVDLATIHQVVEVNEGDVLVAKLTFPEAVLDSVEHLTIGDSPYRFLWMHYGADYDWYDDASPEFYSGWKFPNLKTLVSELHIPPPDILPDLTEFTLDISTHEAPERDAEDSRPFLDALANFLNSQPALKTFKFIVGEYAYTPLQSDINLPGLRTLHLENRYAHPESVRTLRSVSRALWIPEVRSISLSVSVANVNDLGGRKGNGWVSTFFPHGKSFRSLGTFRLEYTVENNISSQFLRDIKWFPVLNDVDVCTSSAPVISGLLEHELWIDSHLVDVRFLDSHPNHKTVVREYNFREEGMSSRSFFE
ncbi:hypothetical protein ACEPAF_6729 [Sanghuangporus sanghuang]